MSNGEESEDAFDPSPLPQKRRRINHQLFDDIEDDPISKPRPRSRQNQRQRGSKPSIGTTKSPKKPTKLKHLIHVHHNAIELEDRYYTQVPDLSSSPSRIRGARWQKPPPKESTVEEEYHVKLEQSRSPPKQTQLDEEFEFDDDIELDFVREEPLVSSHVEMSGSKSGQVAKDMENGTVMEKTHSQPIVPASQVDYDLAGELADLPSDAFASSSPSLRGSPQKSAEDAIFISSQASPSKRPNLAAPLKGLRQLTLFGGAAQQMSEASQATKKHNYPVANKNEKPTHHKLDIEAMKTWVYPTNLGTIRDYQFNIVSRGLYHNLLVALPTGLGKTFIAATIMLNWYRWTKDSQIVFVAPTKPLVSQQVEACFGIAGIPRSQTSMLTGGISPGLRAEDWNSKRVFFMTPQTIINDLKTGICDPKRIVLLVVDEAHRATGNYAYVEVVKFLQRFNNSFRVLALTATPGSSVEAVQEVIDGLQISRVEIRTEFSLDIRQYVHSRKTETVTFDNSEEMELIMDFFSKALQPVLNKLNQFNAYWAKDPMQLTAYGLTIARQKWMNTPAGKNANAAVKGMVIRIFSVLASLAHSIELLKFHGIGPFYHGMVNFRNTQEGMKGGKYEKEVLESEHFIKMMTRLQFWINNPRFIGHPKLDHLQGLVLSHFVDAGEGRGSTHGQPPSATRVMIFAHYRDSAEEIVRVLKRNEPMIRPHVFVGQAASKGSEGMDQKRQLEIISDFKTGKYNTLVATSIGEEGLDIGEIDLIICYDSSASPIRMLQRMGRTGRKRAGNIVLLLMRGKEENSFATAKDSYEKMQQMIAAGTRFNFHEDLSPRIIPREIQPVVDKRVVEIPVENTQGDLPEPKKRGRAPKRPPKKFHMPDGVRTGFVKASRMDGEDGEEVEQRAGARKTKYNARKPMEDLEPIPPLEEVLLNEAQERELKQKYRNIQDGASVGFVIAKPQLDTFPRYQRRLGQTTFVRHGRVSTATVKLLQTMHNMNQDHVDRFRDEANIQNLKKLCGKDIRVVSDVETSDDELPPIPAARKAPVARPKSRLRKAEAKENDGAVEAASSSPPRTSPRLQLQSQGISLGSDTSGEDEEEELDSELRNFVVEDGDVEPEATLTSSLSVSKATAEPFYISPTYFSSSDSDLPELPSMIQTRLTDPEFQGLSTNKDNAKAISPRKRKRNVIEDSSD